MILVPVMVYFYFTGGSAPVATTDSDMPFEAMLARKAQHARIDKDMPKTVPIQANEVNYLAGAELYKQHCAVCHGVPLTPKTASWIFWPGFTLRPITRRFDAFHPAITLPPFCPSARVNSPSTQTSA